MKSEPRKRVDLALRHVNLSMGRLAKRADNNFDSFPGGNSLMRITKKKIVGAVAVSAVVALGAGSAYAFWTSTGTGTGSASTGAPVNVQINQTSSAAGLYPGASATLSGDFTNTNPYAVQVNGITAAVRASSLPAGCAASNFTFGGAQGTASGLAPASGTGGSWSGITITMVNDLVNNQDACKNASLIIDYTSASSVVAP